MNEVYGFSLFNDIEDDELRNRNRAVILANIAEQYTRKGKITGKGVGLILTYFEKITDSDKGDVEGRFKEAMKERGFNVSE